MEDVMAYTVTLSHHSISRAPEYKAETIEEAKKIGDNEFSGGFNDHEIIVCDEQGNTVASRRLGDDEWSEID
jgi:23S rRNA pseudoU1915 N3-methylase RlmH